MYREVTGELLLTNHALQPRLIMLYLEGCKLCQCSVSAPEAVLSLTKGMRLSISSPHTA